MTTDAVIELTVGDYKTLLYNIDMDTGKTLTACWFTVKEDLEDPDNAAIFQLQISSSLTATGQITDVTNGAFNFILSEANTSLLLPNWEYKYAVKRAYATTLETNHVETGTLLTLPQGVRDDS